MIEITEGDEILRQVSRPEELHHPRRAKGEVVVGSRA